MSITINTGVTSIAPTGGSAKAFAVDGQTVTNGAHYSDGATADFRVRPHLTVKNRNPQRQSDGTYSKGKKELILTVPFLKANGTIAFCTDRYSHEYDPEVTAASDKDIRFMMAQLLFDAEMESFHVSGGIPA